MIVIEFMFLGINMFWALLRAHFNPRLTARAKMSLSRAQNIFMHANINSIVLFEGNIKEFETYLLGWNLNEVYGLSSTKTTQKSESCPSLHNVTQQLKNNLEEILTGKWHLIQQQASLNEILKNRSWYYKEVGVHSKTCSWEQNHNKGKKNQNTYSGIVKTSGLHDSPIDTKCARGQNGQIIL